MRRWILITTLLLAASPAAADDRFVGVGFGTSPLFTYGVNVTGEIALLDQTAETTVGELVRVDEAGRFAVTLSGPHDIDVWRPGPAGSFALAASAEQGADLFPSHLDLALSPDGRLLLVLFTDITLPEPQRWTFRTFLINNRLEPRWTGSALTIPEMGNAILWAISERAGYTTLVGLGVGQEVAVLSITPSGEITDTGQRIAAPGLLNVPFDISADGRWAISGGAINSDIALFEVHEDGTVELADSADYNVGQVGTQGLRFAPDLSAIVGLSLINDVGTAAFSPETLLGDVIDFETAGLGGSEALDVSHGGSLVLLDSQSGAGQFSLYSFFLSSDGQLTLTGHTLAKGFKLSDLQLIPPLTPPTLPGDVNLDGVVDAADVVFVINEALPDDKPILLPQPFANADLDGDIDIDDDDLALLIDLLLGSPLP